MLRVSETTQGYLCPSVHLGPTWQRGGRGGKFECPQLCLYPRARRHQEAPSQSSPALARSAPPRSKTYKRMSALQHQSLLKHRCTPQNKRTYTPQPASSTALTPIPNIQLLGAAGPPPPGRSPPPSCGTGHCPPGSFTVSSSLRSVCLSGGRSLEFLPITEPGASGGAGRG